MGDSNASDLGFNPKGENGSLLLLSPSPQSQACPTFGPSPSIPIRKISQLLSGYHSLKDSFFALVVPPWCNTSPSSFETAAKETTSYFAVRGDSTPEFDASAGKSTPYIILDIHGRLPNRKATARVCYLALSFTQPAPGCGPETSRCMMFTLHHTETRKKRGTEGKAGEVDQLIEVYSIGPLDEQMKQRIVRNRGKGKEKENVNYGNEDGAVEWPRIDEDFINSARSAFSREFDNPQDMAQQEDNNRPNGKDSGEVCAEVQPGVGPSESVGPSVGVGEIGDLSQPVNKTECGNGLGPVGPVTSTGQGGRPQKPIQKDESYDAVINATTADSSNHFLSSQGYVPQPLNETLHSAYTYGDEGTNITGVATPHTQYQYHGPFNNVPGIPLPRPNHRPTPGAPFPSYISEYPITAFDNLQSIAQTQDLRQFPPQDSTRVIAETYGNSHQPTGPQESGWFDHPNSNTATFDQDRNTPHGRIQYPRYMGETIQGVNQTQEYPRWYSNGFQAFPGYQGFPEFNVQPFAHIATPPQFPRLTGSTTRTQVYPHLPSQWDGQILPPTFTPLRIDSSSAHQRRHLQTRNAVRDPNRRTAQSPYPDIQRREHIGAGSALARKWARDDRLGEAFVRVSRMLPDQNVTGGSQLARANAGSAMTSSRPLQQIQSHLQNGMDSFIHEGSLYGDHFRSFPSRSHCAELAVPAAGNDTDWNHMFFPVNPDLMQQQHGPIPPPATSGTAGYNNFGNFPPHHE